jgi:hypothetical protein
MMILSEQKNILMQMDPKKFTTMYFTKFSPNQLASSAESSVQVVLEYQKKIKINKKGLLFSICQFKNVS